MGREQWSSRAAFIVAAVGSAIGFGNVWRFPSLAFRYGGGAFFVPYVLALLLIGVPLLLLEVAVGQYYQTGDAGAFGRVNKRFRGVGLSSVICSFVVTLYYCVLLAWVLRMFIYSFQGSEGRWSGEGSDAFAWFVGTVTGLDTAPDADPTRLVGPNVAALAVVWVAVFLCLAFGVKWTGRIAYFTVGLPVLFLLILLVRAVTLDGAGAGVRAYIGEWDLSVLADEPAVWSEAVTQVFFSLGVTFGVMTAYASYNRRDSPVFSNSLIIALSNSAYSVIAGFAVFGVVGYIAAREGKPVDQLENISGPALVFATYPLALSTLPGAGHWERLFFVALFLLGIDSAFSLAEAAVTVCHDTLLLRRSRRVFVVAGVCVFGFLGGLLYTTDTGLLFLDTTDFYVNFMMLLVGFFETFAVGWVYSVEEQVARLGAAPVLAFAAATFGPLSLASGFWFGSETKGALKGFIALGAGYLVLLGGTLVLLQRAISSRKDDGLTWGSALGELLMGNVLRFRADVGGVVRYIPWAWCVLVRHFIPPALLVLFANLAAADTAAGKPKFGNYEGFKTGYQAVGIGVFALSLGVVVLGLVFPRAYACFDVSDFGARKGKDAVAGDAPADDVEASQDA